MSAALTTTEPLIAPTQLPHPDTMVPDPEDADGDQYLTHIADKDSVMEGYLLGQPVTALCGYTWVPTRNPEKYPICQKCSEIFKAAFGREAPSS